MRTSKERSNVAKSISGGPKRTATSKRKGNDVASAAASDGVAILHRRYVGDDPARQAELEQVRREMALGEKLHLAREAAGLTQAALARQIGTQPSAISRLEAADYDGHSMDTLRRVADALGLMLVVDFIPKPQPPIRAARGA